MEQNLQYQNKNKFSFLYIYSLKDTFTHFINVLIFQYIDFMLVIES